MTTRPASILSLLLTVFAAMPLAAQPATTQIEQTPSLVQQQRLGDALRDRAGTTRSQDVVVLPAAESAPVRGADSLRLSPGDLVVEKTGTLAAPTVRVPAAAPERARHREAAAPPRTGDPLRVDLPYTIDLIESGDRQRQLRAVVEIDLGGMHYDRVSRQFAGRLLVGLVDARDIGSEAVLERPITVTLSGEAHAAPATFAISRVNLPFETVNLAVRAPERDTLRLHLRTSFDPEGVGLSVPVRRPTLALSASAERILGFGLEQTRLNVAPPAGLDTGDSVLVAVTAERGRMQPDRFWLGAAGATVDLRSAGRGASEVRLAGGPYSGSTSVEFETPWIFLLVGVAGAFLGGLLRGISHSRESDARTYLLLGTQGMLAGLVAPVLAAIGINVLPAVPEFMPTEAVSFSLAFLVGLGGPTVFDRFLPRYSVGFVDEGASGPRLVPATGENEAGADSERVARLG